MLPKIVRASSLAPLLILFGCLDFESAGQLPPDPPTHPEDLSPPAEICASDATCALNLGPFVTGVVTLEAGPFSIERALGDLSINGVEARPVADPSGFSFDWGDGTSNKSYFIATHHYADNTRNHVVRVTCPYQDGSAFTREFAARFTSPAMASVSFPDWLRVTIPTTGPLPPSLWQGYSLPTNATLFDSATVGIMSVSKTEHVLTAAASLMAALLKDDLARVNGEFRQVALHHPVVANSEGHWFTDPPSFSFGGFAPSAHYVFPFVSFFYGMSQNFIGSTPANYRFGGRIDGATGAFLIRSTAHILARATAYELVNDPERFGLPADLVVDIRWDLENHLRELRRTAGDYVDLNLEFRTWDNPATNATDEALPSVSTLAHRFMVHAEAQGQGYGLPALRLMAFLRRFNPSILDRYAVNIDSPQADKFRATYMVAALSFAFETDLRAEFRTLRFPIDDAAFAELRPL